MDFVLVASSTAKYVREVATAALEVGIDYLDIHYSQDKMPVLQAMASRIKDAGLCFITEAGFHPGLPAAFVRYVGQDFDRLDRAVVATVMSLKGGIPLTDSLYELVEEFKNYQGTVFKDGRWRKAGMWHLPKIDFGAPFGRRICFPLDLEEMRAIPALYPSLRETACYVGGFNWFVDWVIFPVIMVTLRIWPQRAVKPMGRLMYWGMKTFSRPPYGVVLQVQARGEKDGKAKQALVRTFHEDGYDFTAIPVAACMLQYLDGSIRQPGLWLMGHLVDPHRLFRDMERMGIQVKATFV